MGYGKGIVVQVVLGKMEEGAGWCGEMCRAEMEGWCGEMWGAEVASKGLVGKGGGRLEGGRVVWGCKWF